MPLYEYHCQSCGEEFEKMVRFSELDKPVECPACQSVKTQKRISLFASGGLASSGSFASSGSSCGSSGGFS
jgi:putative FmdB family regulatory protein